MEAKVSPDGQLKILAPVPDQLGAVHLGDAEKVGKERIRSRSDMAADTGRSCMEPPIVTPSKHPQLRGRSLGIHDGARHFLIGGLWPITRPIKNLISGPGVLKECRVVR